MQYTRDFRQTYNAVLNYKQTFFKDHNVELMLGTEYYDKYYRQFKATGQGAATDDLPDLGLTDPGANKRSIDSEHKKLRILSSRPKIHPADTPGKNPQRLSPSKEE